MVSSVDGFIAKKDGDISWMHSKDQYKKGVALTHAKIKAFIQAIDCYIMGSKTYELARKLGWPYGEKPVFVMSRRTPTTENDKVTFYQGDLTALIQDHIRPRYKTIWVVGGAHLTKAFLRSGLVDRIVQTIIPIILGDGTLFFDYIGKEIPLHLFDVTAYNDGMVELTYDLVRNPIA